MTRSRSNATQTNDAQAAPVADICLYGTGTFGGTGWLATLADGRSLGDGERVYRAAARRAHQPLEEARGPGRGRRPQGPRDPAGIPEEPEAEEIAARPARVQPGVPPRRGHMNPSQLRAAADRFQKTIDEKRRPMTQNPTPKRMREYNSRLHDADNMERTQRALRAMADAVEAGTLPPELAGLRYVKDVATLVHKGLKGGGYYDVIPDPEYRNTSRQGRTLQAMIDRTFTPAELAERQRQARLRQLEDSIRFVKVEGFFPTPAPVVGMMLARADLSPGLKALEPSAGKGDIADALRARGADVDVVEIRHTLREILKAKGHRLTGDDFLKYEHADGYDRVVMNPPFERYEYIDHVRRAYELLKPGGRLVSLIPAGITGQTRKPREFREWIDDAGATVDPLGPGAFNGAGAFRTTGVSVSILTIDKPELEEPEAAFRSISSDE